jgi:proline racemase
MRVIDSHTAGEPTRVMIGGCPNLGDGPLAERAERLQAEHAQLCQAVLREPRGHDAIVGALLVPPSDPSCAAGVIFFNTASNLGMCGHASIGTAVTLAYLDRIGPGAHRLETPVGVVNIELLDANTVRLENVTSYRLHHHITVNVPGVGPVRGDVAWGGNWFFLTHHIPVPLRLTHVDALTHAAKTIRSALWDQGITGADGAYIDHIELMGPAHNPRHQGRNFVLCPGGAYDRSPCGTGCSAKLACLAADGKLVEDTEWIQESVIDSTYQIRYRHAPDGGGVIPTITGQAFVTADSTLIFNPNDPYRDGIRDNTKAR